MNHEDVRQYFSGIGIEWSFNLPRAGGVFERMVRSTKRCLKKMVGQAKLSYDELLTAVTEVEMIINSRPLSYVSADDLEEPLTPSHLMIGRRVLSLPDHTCNTDEVDWDVEITSAHLTKRAEYLEKTLNHFRKRWRNEYLLELRDHHRHHKGDKDAVLVAVVDVVVVHSEDRPRGFWTLAKVEHTVVGRDGLVRGALRTDKAGRPIVLRRPVQLLYPLEISCQSEMNATSEYPLEDSANGDRANADPPPSVSRPKRAAAPEARHRVKGIIMYENDITD